MPIYKIPGKKKDGLQKYRVVYNYTDAEGKKRTKERLVYGRGQAEAAERELRAAVNREKAESGRSAGGMTVKELWKMYERERRHDVRETTMDRKGSVIRNQVLPLIGDVPLPELDFERLTRWRTELNETGRKASTKNGAYRDLRAMLNFAVARRLIPENPLKGVPPFRDPYKEADAAKLRYYTKEEFREYAAAARAWAERRGDLRGRGIFLFFEIAYYTGMRKGEINGLRWSDVEDGRYLWVRRSIAQKLKGKPWIETPPKSQASVRRIQMPEALADELAAHRERQRRAAGWNEGFFICGGPAPIPDTTLEKANADFAAAAGVKRITVHEFRHSHASLLCNAGINIKEIARRLGHADSEITLKTYAHLYPAEEERAVSVLNGI